MCGFYDVSVAKFGQVNNLITGAENFGDARGRVRRIRFHVHCPPAEPGVRERRPELRASADEQLLRD